MKKVKNIIEENGQGFINLKSGKKIPVPIKTIYTYYDDNTNDCRVEMLRPLSIAGKQEEI